MSVINPFRNNFNKNVATRRDQSFHHLKSNFADRIPLADANDPVPTVPTNLELQKPPGGYEEGSLIYNKSNNTGYVRTTTPGNVAHWTPLGGSGGGGTTTLQIAYDNTETAADIPSIQTTSTYGPVTIRGSDDGVNNLSGLQVFPSLNPAVGTQSTVIMQASDTGSALQLYDVGPNLIFEVQSDGVGNNILAGVNVNAAGGSNNVIMGVNSSASGMGDTENVVIGSGANVVNSTHSVSIGGGNGAGSGPRTEANGSVAIGGADTMGFGARAIGLTSIAIGGGDMGVNGARAGIDGGIVIGTGSVTDDSTTMGTNNILNSNTVIGTLSSVVVSGGSSSNNAIVRSSVVGPNSIIESTGSNAEMTDNVILGSSASITSSGSMGMNVFVNAGIAIGFEAQIDAGRDNNANNCISIGSSAVCTADNQICIGQNSNNSDTCIRSIAMGTGANNTDCSDSVTIGTNASASSNVAIQNNVCIGTNSQVQNSSNSTSVGNNTICQTADSVAIGNGSQCQDLMGMNLFSGCVAIGSNAETSDVSNAIAMGTNSNCDGDDSICIGSSSNINTGIEAVAVGPNTSVTQTSGIALGSGAVSQAVSGTTPGGATAQVGLPAAMFSTNTVDTTRVGAIQIRIAGTDYWIPLLTVG